MSDAFNGWANTINVQKEDNFNGSSSSTVYSLVGKVRFTHAPLNTGKGLTIDVWRNQSKNFVTSQYFNGTIEIELGFHALMQMLFTLFFEQASPSVTSGGFTTSNFKMPRLHSGFIGAPDIGSFKIGLAYNPGGTEYLFEGVVIDSIRLDIRRNQTPRITIEYKAAKRTKATLAGSVTTVANRLTNHTQCTATLNGDPLALFTEANLTFSHAKQPTRFGSDGKPTRFGYNGLFAIKGEVAEYYNPDSAFPDCVEDQADHAFTLQMLDPAGTSRKIVVTLPRVNFDSGTPDGIGPGELVYRGNCTGLQDTDLTTSANILLVV